jgi:hypothetical protein
MGCCHMVMVGQQLNNLQKPHRRSGWFDCWHPVAPYAPLPWETHSSSIDLQRPQGHSLSHLTAQAVGANKVVRKWGGMRK